MGFKSHALQCTVLTTKIGHSLPATAYTSSFLSKRNGLNMYSMCNCKVPQQIFRQTGPSRVNKKNYTLKVQLELFNVRLKNACDVMYS